MKAHIKVSIKQFIIPSIPLAILLVLSCVGLWFSAYFGTRYTSPVALSTNIFNDIDAVITPNSLLSNLIGISFTLLNAFLLAQINNRFTIIRTRTFLPLFVFLLLMSSWNETHIVSGSHLVLTLMLLAMFYILSMSRDKKSSEQAFMGSLLISVSSLIINSYIFIIPVCWIGFMIFQSFSLRTFLASVFGTLAPWVLFISAKYLFINELDFQHILIIKPNIEFGISTVPMPVLIYSAAFICISIVSIIGLYSLSNSDAIHTRNKLNFLVLLYISLLILAFVFRNQFILFLPLIAMVFSLLFAHPFTLKQNNFYGIIFIIFCAINIAYVISKYILF
ncbi:MAG TPA: hypothetical protein VI413_05115 [Paludibacter sp.]